MSHPHIRILCGSDADVFQALRLRGLGESPTAFSSSYEEECDLSAATIKARLDDQAQAAVIGAFIDSKLVGMMGVRRDRYRKLAHRAVLWAYTLRPK